LNIIEQDFSLLGKLIFSLAVILYSSVNTIVIFILIYFTLFYLKNTIGKKVLENMIKALLDFIWAFKNHTEPFVTLFYFFNI